MPTLQLILSVVTTGVTIIFTALVLARWNHYRQRGRHAPHLLAWAFGLGLYALAAGAQIGLHFVWSPLLLGLWYWAGVLMTAAWLGQGSIYLLVRRGHIARNLGWALAAITALLLPWVLLATPYHADAWTQGVNLFADYKALMETGQFRVLVAVLNAYGTIGLVGGALYSAWLFRRKEILRNRMVGNWLIAAGGLLPALTGTFTKYGMSDLNTPSLLVGVSLIFVGYVLSTQAKDELAQRSARHTAPATTR